MDESLRPLLKVGDWVRCTREAYKGEVCQVLQINSLTNSSPIQIDVQGRNDRLYAISGHRHWWKDWNNIEFANPDLLLDEGL